MNGVKIFKNTLKLTWWQRSWLRRRIFLNRRMDVWRNVFSLNGSAIKLESLAVASLLKAQKRVQILIFIRYDIGWKVGKKIPMNTDSWSENLGSDLETGTITTNLYWNRAALRKCVISTNWEMSDIQYGIDTESEEKGKRNHRKFLRKQQNKEKNTS